MADRQASAPGCADPNCLGHEIPEPLSAAPRGRKISQYPAIRGLWRFFSWWLVFSGIYASSSVCPFCGQPGCPVGVASAGIIGGFFATIWIYGKGWLARLKALIAPRLRGSGVQVGGAKGRP